MEFASNIGIFPFLLGVFVDRDLLNSEISRMQSKPFELKGNPSGFCIELVHGETNELAICVYISLEKHPCDVSLLHTIVHESVHVKQKVMKHIGEKKIGIETEAYFIDSVFAYIFSQIAELKEKQIKLIESVQNV